MTVQASKYDAADLRAMVAEGMSTTEIAAEIGATGAGVRSAMRRHGIDRPGQRIAFRSIRERAEAMKPLDAVDYLLGCLENMADALCSGEAWHPLDDAVPGLQRAPRRLLIALWDADGGMVTHNALMGAYCVGRLGDDPAPSIINVQIHKLRKALPASVGRIENDHGRGYRLVRA